jgi:hypothetical protein
MQMFLSLLTLSAIRCVHAWYNVREQWAERRAASHRTEVLIKVKALHAIQMMYLEMERDQFNRVFEERLRRVESLNETLTR